jgi:hypothetical protein
MATVSTVEPTALIDRTDRPPPPRSARWVVRIIIAFVALGLLVFVVGQGWRGPRTLTATGTPTDTFADDTERGLGRTDDGRTWETPAGRWRVSQGRARPIGDPDTVQWLAVVEGNSTRGVVAARIASAAEGSGVVFRYEDLANYWSFTAVPAYAAWVIRHVQHGTIAFERAVPLATADSGTLAEVRFEDDWMEFLIDGVRAETVYDPSGAGATGVGLIAAFRPALDARFDDFYALPE